MAKNSPGRCFARPPSLLQAKWRVKFTKPSLPFAVERVDQRSVVGVSKFAATLFAGVISKTSLNTINRL